MQSTVLRKEASPPYLIAMVCPQKDFHNGLAACTFTIHHHPDFLALAPLPCDHLSETEVSYAACAWDSPIVAIAPPVRHSTLWAQHLLELILRSEDSPIAITRLATGHFFRERLPVFIYSVGMLVHLPVGCQWKGGR